jgi:hypothetical protein
VQSVSAADAKREWRERRGEEKRRGAAAVVRRREIRHPKQRKMAPTQSGRGSSNNGNKGLTGDGAWVASTDTGSGPTGVQEIGYR